MHIHFFIQFMHQGLLHYIKATSAISRPYQGHIKAISSQAKLQFDILSPKVIIIIKMIFLDTAEFYLYQQLYPIHIFLMFSLNFLKYPIFWFLSHISQHLKAYKLYEQTVKQNLCSKNIFLIMSLHILQLQST